MGENVYHTGYLAQPRNITVGDIGHVGFPIERKHVVFAE